MCNFYRVKLNCLFIYPWNSKFSCLNNYFHQDNCTSSFVKIENQKFIKKQFIETKKRKDETKTPSDFFRNLSNTKVVSGEKWNMKGWRRWHLIQQGTWNEKVSQKFSRLFTSNYSRVDGNYFATAISINNFEYFQSTIS